MIHGALIGYDVRELGLNLAAPLGQTLIAVLR